MASTKDERKGIITETTGDPQDSSSYANEERGVSDTKLDYAGSAAKTDADEIKLVRKLDIWMLPILFILNFISILKRQSIAVAPLGGLNDDLGLVGTQFSTVVSVHYVGYILGQVPSNLLMTRVPPSYVLAASALFGGIISICVSAVNSFQGLALQRFFLGIIVAPIWPGTLYVVSSFYKRKELGTRISILYTSNVGATAFQGLIAAPIFSELGGARGLGGWQWMFVTFGTAAGIFSVIAFFTLPNTPSSTWWLSARERHLAHNRMTADTVERKSDVSIIRGLKQVIKDKHVWLFAFMHHIHTASSGFRSFLPTLLDTLGYDTTTTLALTCPPYLLASAVAIGVGLSSGKYNERTWHITGLKITAITGFVLGCASLNTASRLVASFLFVGWTYGCTSLTLGWVGITCGQTKEKRAAALALVNTFATLSQVWAPYLWPDSAAPRYVMPLAASAAMCVVGVAMAWTIKGLIIAGNKRMRTLDSNVTLVYAY